MNHWDRLQGQLRSELPDCLPIALWRHWPQQDQDPHALAMATLAWQRRFDFDLVRYMPSNTGMAEYWGARARFQPNNPCGLRTIEQYAVTAPDQWARLRPSSLCARALVDCNDGLRQVADALGGTAPLLQSVTSPLTTAWQLAGDAIFEHMETAPELLDAGLRAIADTAASFALQAIESGACGIALEVVCPVANRMSAERYLLFGRAWDLHVLGAIRDVSQLNMSCVGECFDTAASYPVQILNWYDRSAGPDLRAGASRFAGIVAGGLDAAGSLGRGSRADIDCEVVAAIDCLTGARAMIAAGGPCMLDTPEGNIDGAIDAVRRRAIRPQEENKP